MCLIIRADASPTIGTGHVMRCLAIAQWAKKLNISCTLMGRIQVSWVLARLEKEGINYIVLSDNISKEEKPWELMQSLAAAPQNSWVILDGYHFTLECQKAVRAAGHKLLIIDDYAHLPEYSCDILLNQNIGAEELKYKGDIAQKCLGLEYVLLRQEFIEARKKAKQRIFPTTPQNILLTLGGGDFSQHLQKIVPYLEIPEMVGRTLRIIAGAMKEDVIRCIFKNCRAQIEVLHTVDDMPTLLLSTDLCISAGGSTCWELCYLGVPFVTMAVAENQARIISFLQQNEVALNILQLHPQEFAHCLQEDGYSLLLKQTMQNKHTIDGGKKIISYIKNNIHSSELQLRSVRMEDVDFIFEIANDPLTRNMSFHTQNITYEEHISWFKAQIAYNTSFYIMLKAQQPCAYVRFALDNSQYIISIAVHPHFRTLGLAKHIIQEACQKFFSETQSKRILAYIKQDNIASIRAFQSAGFSEILYSKDNVILLELKA